MEAALAQVAEERLPALRGRFAKYFPLLEILHVALLSQCALRDKEVRLLIASHGELLVEEKSRLDAMSTDMTRVIGW